MLTNVLKYRCFISNMLPKPKESRKILYGVLSFSILILICKIFPYFLLLRKDKDFFHEVSENKDQSIIILLSVLIYIAILILSKTFPADYKYNKDRHMMAIILILINIIMFTAIWNNWNKMSLISFFSNLNNPVLILLSLLFLNEINNKSNGLAILMNIFAIAIVILATSSFKYKILN